MKKQLKTLKMTKNDLERPSNDLENKNNCTTVPGMKKSEKSAKHSIL